VMKKLARRAGGHVPGVQVQALHVRSLEEMALENVVEGCVRETFGAVVAMIQAERAGDARVRRAMRRIARDETRHAELSWADSHVVVDSATRVVSCGSNLERSGRDAKVGRVEDPYRAPWISAI
jgi:hypothetical protein